LQSDKLKWYIWVLGKYKFLKNKIVELCENFDNHLGKSPLALRVVPLPGFTKNPIFTHNAGQNRHNASQGCLFSGGACFRNYMASCQLLLNAKIINIIIIILNILWFIFIPRCYKYKPLWSKIGRNSLSPFSRVILYESNDDIYDNPATEAVIDFLWPKAKRFFTFLFIRFFIFAACFVILVNLDKFKVSSPDEFKIFNVNSIAALIVMFYYLAGYLLVTEIIQLYYHGPRKYFGDIFNIFDIASIVLPVAMVTVRVFSNPDPADNRLMVGFSIFLLWIELVKLVL
jgi:hypothetical protein